MMDSMNIPSPTGNVPEFTLGDRLRKAREAGGLTPEQMADVLDVTQKTVNNYENDRTPVKRPVAITWALATGCDAEWLWTGLDGPDASPQDTMPNTQRYSRDDIMNQAPIAA